MFVERPQMKRWTTKDRQSRLVAAVSIWRYFLLKVANKRLDTIVESLFIFITSWLIAAVSMISYFIVKVTNKRLLTIDEKSAIIASLIYVLWVFIVIASVDAELIARTINSNTARKAFTTGVGDRSGTRLAIQEPAVGGNGAVLLCYGAKRQRKDVLYQGEIGAIIALSVVIRLLYYAM